VDAAMTALRNIGPASRTSWCIGGATGRVPIASRTAWQPRCMSRASPWTGTSVLRWGNSSCCFASTRRFRGGKPRPFNV